jgi:hypothetical protein
MVDHDGRTVDYGYDATYRLLNETITSDPQGTNGPISYRYDEVGNRLSRTSDVSGVIPNPVDCLWYNTLRRIGAHAVVEG